MCDTATGVILIGIIYEWVLVRVDAANPLRLIKYFGQSCRSHGQYPTSAKLLAKRKQEHAFNAKYDPKETGLRAAINEFGVDAFDVAVLALLVGPDADVHTWANREEIRLIAENGGVLRDMHPKLPIQQTLNMTNGGTGAAVVSKLLKSNIWMETVVERMKKFAIGYPDRESNVGTTYVCKDGFPLGEKVHQIRKRAFFDPKWVPILEALPQWTWNGKKGKAFKEAFRRRVNVGIEAAGGQSVVTKRQHENPERNRKFRVTKRATRDARRAKERALLSPVALVAYDKKCKKNDQRVIRAQKARERASSA